MQEETIDTYLHLNKSGKISAKKVMDSCKYELFTEETIFDKLSSEELRQINNALIKVSKQYNELFEIYGLYDKRKDNKLKVILLSGKYKRIKRFNGFVYRAGNKDEDRNIIYINIENIIKNKDNIEKETERILRHETVHAIINDNVRNSKSKKTPALWIEEGLAESANIISGDSRFYVSSMDKVLKSKYYFGANLLEYLYLKNNKDNGMFKEMLKNSDISPNNAIKEAGNKAGIKGGFKDIIKYWVKEKYGADDKTAENFIEDFKLYKRYRSW